MTAAYATTQPHRRPDAAEPSLFVREILLKSIYLARSAKLPEGLYILPMFFLYLFFFSGRPQSHAGSEANGPIFTKISGLVDN